MRSNCLIEAWRIYRALAQHDQPGARAWFGVTRSWERGVPFHAGVLRPVPGTELFELVHFQPVKRKRRWWWPEWKFDGFRKRGDFPPTDLPEGGRW